MKTTLYYISTNAYDFLMTDDGTTRRVLANEYGECPRNEYGEYIDLDGFMNAVEDDSSWEEYSESAEELIGDGEIVAKIEDFEM